MDINVRNRNNVRVITLRGDLRLGDALNSFREITDNLVEEGNHHFLLNLGEVRMIDSSGVGLLIKLMASAKKAGGTVKLANPSDFVVKSLRLVGLLSLFEVFPDDESAFASFQ